MANKRSQMVFMSNLRDKLDGLIKEYPMPVTRQAILEILLETYIDEMHTRLKDKTILTIYDLRDEIRNLAGGADNDRK